MQNRFLLILLSLSFSGCSLIYSYSDNLPQRVDAWVLEKKYNTALNTIKYIKPSHKDYRLLQNKKKNIQKLMQAYEEAAIKKSTLLTTQGDWIKAIKLLDEVSDNITNETEIDKHRLKLLTERKIVIASLEKDVLYKYATNLIEKIPLYKKIKKVVSKDEANQLGISRFDSLREETSFRLSILGEQQYNKNKFNNALYTINLALKLEPELDTIEKLKTIKKNINKATKSKRAESFKKAKSLLSKLSQGYSHSILNKTKATVAWLDKNKDTNKTYVELADKLKKHLTKGIKQRFEAASNLYSKGKTQEALSIWIELKELEPNNAKLQSHIERAEKVLDKLKKLSNKPENKK